MYAIIVSGGKQYRVSEGESLRVEKLAGAVGDKVVFDRVLMIGGDEKPRIGTPALKGAKVEAEITAQKRGPKLIVFKYKPKKMYRRKRGHRQPYTELRVTGITG